MDAFTKCVVVSLTDTPMALPDSTSESAVDALVQAFKLLQEKSPSTVLVADSSGMTAKLTFKQNERISGRWKKGSTWWVWRVLLGACGR
jgi:hypothetical protein